MKNMVMSLPQITIPFQIFEECVVGKQYRPPFLKDKSWRAKEILELIHSNICGSISLISNRGKRYVITFIDGYSRKNWVIFYRKNLRL